MTCTGYWEGALPYDSDIVVTLVSTIGKTVYKGSYKGGTIVFIYVCYCSVVIFPYS